MRCNSIALQLRHEVLCMQVLVKVAALRFQLKYNKAKRMTLISIVRNCDSGKEIVRIYVRLGYLA